MQAKQAGKRYRRTVAGRSRDCGRRTASAPRREEALTPKQRWQLAQMVVSGSLFVLLVAVTWFVPGRAEGLNSLLTEAMSRNMDVQAVFSAVGQAFAGDGREGIYRAVFGPETAEPKAVEISGLHGAAAWEILRKNRQEPEGTPPEAAPEQPAETLSYILYSALPENVHMEQVILGFDYSMPVNGAMSSGFGYRDHPTEGDTRFHYGVDLAADSGAEVRCFADGNVTVVGKSSSYGNYCIVTHEGGYRTLYAHCSRVTASSGAAVQKGQKIAEVGETGMATGPHLHFELQRQDTYLNPVYYLDNL